MPMFLAEIMAAWSLAVAYLLHLQSADAFRLARWSPIVNILGPTAFILYTAASIPPAAISGRYYATAIEQYTSILEQMHSAANLWQPGQKVDLAKLLAIAPLAESAIGRFADYGRIRRAVSVFNCVAGAILVTVRVPLHFRSYGSCEEAHRIPTSRLTSLYFRSSSSSLPAFTSVLYTVTSESSQTPLRTRRELARATSLSTLSVIK